jgi:hypothetical protein
LFVWFGLVWFVFCFCFCFVTQNRLFRFFPHPGRCGASSSCLDRLCNSAALVLALAGCADQVDLGFNWVQN